jgi:hypothetical protein
MADGVGGWLLLLCRLLVVFHPLSLAVTASGALGALSVRGTAVASILILRLVSAAMDLFVYTTPYFPNNRVPGDTPLYVAATLAYHGAWLLYLARSERVRATYAET